MSGRSRRGKGGRFPWPQVPIGGLNPAAAAGGLSSPARSQFDCLHVGYLPAFHCKSQQGPDDVPSIAAGGAWIHVNEAKRLVAPYFQDVGVTADEQTRPQSLDFLSRTAVVIARVSSDVRHVDVETRTLPNEILVQIGAQFRPVDVPVNAPDWSEGLEPIQNFDRPEVARMPDLVAFGEMPENRVVQKSVCVGKQRDSQFPAYAPPNVPSDAQAIIGRNETGPAAMTTPPGDTRSPPHLGRSMSRTKQPLL